MTKRIKSLFYKYRELIMYVIFGGLTTVVSFASYYLILWLGAHYMAAQVISWVIAVAFAFVVNKLFVFEDKDISSEGLFRQIWQFVSMRLASGAIETGLLWLLVDIILINESIAKLPVAVITVIINYIASKLFVFKKEDRSK